LSGREFWFRDVDSNHDTQLQRLMSYRLDDPGTAPSSLTEPRKPPKTLLPAAEPWLHSLRRGAVRLDTASRAVQHGPLTREISCAHSGRFACRHSCFLFSHRPPAV